MYVSHCSLYCIYVPSCELLRSCDVHVSLSNWFNISGVKGEKFFHFFFHLIVSEELCLLQFRRSVKMNFSWCVKLQPINRFYHKVHNTTTVAKDFGNSTSSRLKCNGGKKAQFFFFFFSHNKLS